MEELWSELNSTQSFSSRERVLNLWVWLCKALLMRGHPVGMDAALKVRCGLMVLWLAECSLFTNQLLSLCGSDELGTLAADGFGVLLTDSQYVLNLKCRAISRVSTQGACSYIIETTFFIKTADILQAACVYKCGTKVSGAVQI